jgi:hypothetical protein
LVEFSDQFLVEEALIKMHAQFERKASDTNEESASWQRDVQLFLEGHFHGIPPKRLLEILHDHLIDVMNEMKEMDGWNFEKRELGHVHWIWLDKIEENDRKIANASPVRKVCIRVQFNNERPDFNYISFECFGQKVIYSKRNGKGSLNLTSHNSEL